MQCQCISVNTREEVYRYGVSLYTLRLCYNGSSNDIYTPCFIFRYQLYPTERHGIRNSEANQHFETMVLSFLQDNL